jgi:hypothetical protein
LEGLKGYATSFGTVGAKIIWKQEISLSVMLNMTLTNLQKASE